MKLPAATSRAGERGGSVMEAGTEKTKWRSIVHSGGGCRKTNTDTHAQLCKGQMNQRSEISGGN